MIPLIPLGPLSAALDAMWLHTALIAALLPIMAGRVALGCLPLRRAHLGIGALACLLSLSHVLPAVPPSPEAQDTRLSGLFGILAGLGLLAYATFRPPEPGRIVGATALSGAIVAAHALAEGRYAHGRLEGIGLNPNYLGTLLALSLVAAIGMTHRTRNLGWLLPATVCGAAMLQTASRGALITAAAGVAVLALGGRPASVRLPAYLAVPALAWLAPGALRAVEGLTTGERGAGELSANTQVRGEVAEFAAGTVLAHPLRGIGLGTFEDHAARAPEFGIYLATHNDYLRLAAEAGMPALLLLLAIVWAGLRNRRPEVCALRAMVACHLVALLFSNPLASTVLSTPFWLALGCLLHSAMDPATDTAAVAAPDRPSPMHVRQEREYSS